MSKSQVTAIAFALLCCWACNPSSRPTEIVDAKQDSIQQALADDSSAQTVPIPANYTLLHNIEQIEYCLPYPENDFKEDFDASEGKGSHVLVSKDKGIRITFQANPLDMTFDQLHELSVRDIQSITGAAPLIDRKESQSFELKWKQGKKLVHLKKWYRQPDNETVTARFEYPEAQMSGIADAITIVMGQSTYCN